MSSSKVSSPEAVQIWRKGLIAEITGKLKTLLETKHLYQSVTIEPPSLAAIVERVQPADHGHLTLTKLQNFLRAGWTAMDPAHPSSYGDTVIVFRSPDLKLFCAKCDRVEAFNLTSAESFLERAHVDTVGGVQVFVASYLCQSCKHVPEVFIVRRSGAKLTLCGRAPMETADVPTLIPKEVREFFRGAVLAYQSGQVLPANSC